MEYDRFDGIRGYSVLSHALRFLLQFRTQDGLYFTRLNNWCANLAMKSSPGKCMETFFPHQNFQPSQRRLTPYLIFIRARRQLYVVSMFHEVISLGKEWTLLSVKDSIEWWELVETTLFYRHANENVAKCDGAMDKVFVQPLHHLLLKVILNT